VSSQDRAGISRISVKDEGRVEKVDACMKLKCLLIRGQMEGKREILKKWKEPENDSPKRSQTKNSYWREGKQADQGAAVEDM